MTSATAPASTQQRSLLPQPLEQLNLAGVIRVMGRDAEHQLAVGPATPFGWNLAQALGPEPAHRLDQPLVLVPQQRHVARPGTPVRRLGLARKVGWAARKPRPLSGL